MKRTVEFYDSTVGAINPVGESMEIDLAPAYVHQIEGEPGNERVTGWNLAVRLVLENASCTGKYPEMPCKLTDGTLKLGDSQINYLIPLPYSETGDVEIWLQFCGGDEVTITATKVELQVSGEAVFIEEFPAE